MTSTELVCREEARIHCPWRRLTQPLNPTAARVTVAPAGTILAARRGGLAAAVRRRKQMKLVQRVPRLSIAALIPPAILLLVFAYVAVNPPESGPMVGVGVGYILVGVSAVLLGIGMLLSFAGVVEAVHRKQTSLVAALVIATVNTFPLAYLVGPLINR